MRNSEYWFAAIGLVLFLVLGGRMVMREIAAPEKPSPPPAERRTRNLAERQQPPNLDKLIQMASSTPAPAKPNAIPGQVVAPDASPMSDTWLSAEFFIEEGITNTQYVRTNRIGAFTLRQVHDAVRVYFRVEKSGFAPVPAEPPGGIFDLLAQPLAAVQIVLAPENTASGIVVDAIGAPLPGVQIGAQSVDPLAYQIQTKSQGDGTFTFGQLGPGEYNLGFFSDGFKPGAEGWQRIRITEGQSVTGLRLVAPKDLPATHYIAGVVVDQAGNPVEDAELRDGNLWYVQTDANGQFATRLSILPLRVVARHRDFSDSEPVLVESSTHDLRVTLRPLATMSGRVVYAKTGKPVTDFRVRASSMDDFTRRYERFTKASDPGGQFAGLPGKAGCNGVEVFVHNFPLTVTSIAPLQPGEKRQGIEVRVAAGTYVEGRVLDATGKPVRLAQVSVKGSKEFGGYEDSTGDDGAFLLGPFVDGPIEISVEKYGQIKTETFNTIVSPTMSDTIVLTLKQQLRRRAAAQSLQ